MDRRLALAFVASLILAFAATDSFAQSYSAQPRTAQAQTAQAQAATARAEARPRAQGRRGLHPLP
jgi:hypothetical protein